MIRIVLVVGVTFYKYFLVQKRKKAKLIKIKKTALKPMAKKAKKPIIKKTTMKRIRVANRTRRSRSLPPSRRAKRARRSRSVPAKHTKKAKRLSPLILSKSSKPAGAPPSIPPPILSRSVKPSDVPPSIPPPILSRSVKPSGAPPSIPPKLSKAEMKKRTRAKLKSESNKDSIIRLNKLDAKEKKERIARQQKARIARKGKQTHRRAPPKELAVSSGTSLKSGISRLFKFDDYFESKNRIFEDITKFLMKYNRQRITIHVIVKHRGSAVPRNLVLSRISNSLSIRPIINSLLNGIEGTFNFYQEQDMSYLETLSQIGIVVKEIVSRPPPKVAHTVENSNCLLRAIYEQTHKVSVLKEDIGKLSNDGFINCWEYLEDKYKCNITVIDHESDVWRRSDKVYKSKSHKYNSNVIVKLHNYHVTSLDRAERDRILRDVQTIEMRYIDEVPHYKKLDDIDGDEKKDKCFSHIRFGEKTKNKDNKGVLNKWVTLDEIEEKHVELLRLGENHDIIVTSTGKIIGLIYKIYSYKSKEMFKYLPGFLIPYNTTKAWSCASYILREFKTYISMLYDKKIIRLNPAVQQISNKVMYELCSNTQSPFFNIHNKHLLRKGSQEIWQIDQRRSYYNTAKGNLPEHLMKYYKGYSTAPRNIKKYNRPLTDELMEEINKVHGFALIKYDQTNLAINTWFDNKNRNVGILYISLPILNYMRDIGIDIFVYEIHYSEYSCDPFKAFFEDRIDPIQKVLYNRVSDDYEMRSIYAETCQDYRLLPNVLIGSLNRKTHRMQVFTTISVEEFDRFIIKSNEDGRLIIKIGWRILDNEELKDIPTESQAAEGDIIQNKQYIIHYQETSDIKEFFNMPHWSKYIIDYQKMVIHNKAMEVTKGDLANLGGIICDSIIYKGEFDYSVEKSDGFFRCEGGGDEFIGIYPGLRAFITNQEIHQKHSGYEMPLTIGEFRKKLIKCEEEEFKYREHKYILYESKIDSYLIDEYDIKIEDELLPGQVLSKITGCAGTGKSELIKFQQKYNGSKMKLEYLIDKYPDREALFKQFDRDSILVLAPTHATRKTSLATMTIQKFFYMLKFGNIEMLNNIQCIVTEEGSMCEGGIWYVIDSMLRYHIINRPFGGLHIYLYADFKQLAPWIGYKCPDNNLIRNCNLFNNFDHLELTENFRQKTDPVFQSILTKIRDSYNYGGDISSDIACKLLLPIILDDKEIKTLNGNTVGEMDQPGDLHVFMSNKKRIEAIECETGFNVIPGNIYVFRSKYERPIDEDKLCIINCDRDTFTREFLIKGKVFKVCNSDMAVVVGTVGAKVEMEMLFNDYSRTGITFWFDLCEFDEPDTKSEEYYSLERKYANICLERYSTVYSCQGKTVNKIKINNEDKMSILNFYVALSRARTLDNVELVQPIMTKKKMVEHNLPAQETYDAKKLDVLIKYYNEIIDQIPNNRRPDACGNENISKSLTMLKRYRALNSKDNGDGTRTIMTAYKEAQYIDRMYSTRQTLQPMQREFRDLLTCDIYDDVDIVNSGPSIMLIYAMKHGLKCDKLKEYVEDREGVFKQMGMLKSYAKGIICALLNGGNHKMCERYEFLKLFRGEIASIMDFIAGYETKAYEVYYERNDKELKENYKKNFTEIRRKFDPDHEMTSLEANTRIDELREAECIAKTRRSCISYICYYYERKTMNFMYNYLKKIGRIVDRECVLSFDGILVRKNDKIKISIDEIEKHIWEYYKLMGMEVDYKYRIKIKVKPMEDVLDVSKYLKLLSKEVTAKRFPISIKLNEYGEPITFKDVNKNAILGKIKIKGVEEIVEEEEELGNDNYTDSEEDEPMPEPKPKPVADNILLSYPGEDRIIATKNYFKDEAKYQEEDEEDDDDDDEPMCVMDYLNDDTESQPLQKIKPIRQISECQEEDELMSIMDYI